MFLQNLMAGVNQIIYSLSSGLKMHFPDYSKLDMPIDDYTIQTTDSCLLTVFEIEGSANSLPADTYRYIIDLMTEQLTPAFRRKGLIIQSCFSSDPSHITISSSLDNIMKESKKTIERMGYGKTALSLLESQKNHLLDILAIEKNFLLVWTTTSSLTPQETKEMIAAYREKTKDAPGLGFGGNPFLSHKLMIDNHTRNVMSVSQALAKCSILHRQMLVSEAVHEMRMGILVSPERDVNIVGDGLKKYSHATMMNDVSIALKERQLSDTKYQYDGSFPKLNEFAKIDVEYAGNNTQVFVDNLYFQPIMMETPPTTVNFFNRLFGEMSVSRVMGKRIPYRIMFTVASDGESLLGAKYNIASLLRRTNLQTLGVFEGLSQMKAFVENQGVAVKFNAHMVTWGSTQEETFQRSALFTTRLEGWGNPKLSIKTGNPIEGLASASMGFSKTGIATPAAAPLDDVLCLLPFARPTSLWNSSPIIFRSRDGKPIPYMPMSAEFQYWVTFVAAEPGSGKSVLANWLNTAFYLMDNTYALPYVSIIDFGFSSKGFINILKRMLPPHQEKYATYQRVENSAAYAVNPHQLGLGLRFPKPDELDYQVNLYDLAVSDASTGQPLPGARDVIESLITRGYAQYSDCLDPYSFATPKVYVKNVLPEIDQILKNERKITYDESSIMIERSANPDFAGRVTTWWEIVDFLCLTKPTGPNASLYNDYIQQAYLAQRYASFTTRDLMTISKNMTELNTRYGGQMLNGVPFLDEVLNRIDKFATSFPIFSNITNFDVEGVYAISLDMEGMINPQPQSPADFKRNSMAFMYALRTLTSKFFLIEEYLDTDFPLPDGIPAPVTMNKEWVKQYHVHNVRQLYKSKKRIMVDEFHYTSSSPQVMKTFATFMRVVRKRNMELFLISQRLDDFVFLPKNGYNEEIDLLYYATIAMILSPLTKDDSIECVRTRLGVKDEGALHSLKYEIKSPLESPTTGGSFFLWMNSSKRGIVTQIVTNKLSSYCLWEFSTTASQVSLRRVMGEVCMDTSLATEILANSFPPHETNERLKIANNEMTASGKTGDPERFLAEMLYKRHLQQQSFYRS